MKSYRLVFVFIYVYLQVIMTGTIVFQTFVMYPNIFMDPPASLQLSMQFFKAVTPGDFFPPFGGAIVLTGSVALLVSFRVKKVFRYLLASVVFLFLGDGVLSILYFWPRNTILFVEGIQKHSAETLQQVSKEFYRAHFVRLFTSSAASFCALIGLLRFYPQTRGPGGSTNNFSFTSKPK
jgi:hypothetical protein